MISLFFVLSVAHADVAPGPFYREDCTVERKEQDGTTCEACATWYGAEDDTGAETCEEQYAGSDYAHVCSSDGASTWTEVWCDGPPREGCGCATGPAGAGWLMGLALLGLLLRRR